MEKTSLPLISSEEWEKRRQKVVKEFREEIGLKFLRDQDIYSSISVKGDPKKIHRMITDEMEVSLGYDVTYDPMQVTKGGFADQIMDVDGKIYGYREYKLKGPFEYGKSIIGFILSIIGILLYFLIPYIDRFLKPYLDIWPFGFSPWLEIIAILLVIIGILYELLDLPHERYSFIPAYNKIWMKELGEAYLGTKEEKVSEAGLTEARGERIVSVHYLSGDVDVHMGAESRMETARVELKKGDFVSGNPLDQEKYERTMGFRARLNLRKKITYQKDARSEYLSFPEEIKKPKKDLKRDVEAIKDRLTKFVEVK